MKAKENAAEKPILVGTRKAVLVGVNDYAPVGSGGPDLSGCVNDAADMATTLKICGFSPSNIRILTNRNATKANILKYLEWLLIKAKPGDSLVFYYSGHGTQVTNINGDIEIDGLDEAIVPHDYPSAGFISDDVLKDVINANLKENVNLEVFLDCCHSGSGTREFSFTGEKPTEQARFLPPMLEDSFYFIHQRELDSKEGEEMTVTRAFVPVVESKHTLWAACKANQVSMEGVMPDGKQHGYFTYNLCKILRATQGKITRKALDAQIAQALYNMKAAQVNETECSRTEFNQMIFF